MRIYPAIDLKDGQCVRLHKGDYSQMTVYGTDPIAMAKEFVDQGATYLHVVDLDGARDGVSKNKKVILDIARSVNIPVQTGGGIRTLATVEEYLNGGIARVILGTGAILNPEFFKEAAMKFKERIVAGIDAKDGYAAYAGWEKVSDLTAVSLAKEAQNLGIQTIIYTDIATDGTLKGPNLLEMEKMAKSVSIEVIASGGVSGIEDLRALVKTGVGGAIVGKAIYAGRIALDEAIKEIESVN